MSTISELLRASAALDGISDFPRLDVEVLLCHVLDRPRSYVYAWPEKIIDDNRVHQFQSLLQRRIHGEPIAHLTGVKEFWSLSLQVNPSTLIPRPETELLVQMILDLTEKPDARLLDLGTGCGAIALALASERRDWHVTGVDREPDAVALAESNRRRLGLDNVIFFESNWFDTIGLQRFDVVVSNPPYIEPGNRHLREGDVRFEPASALVAGEQGLADIRHIITGAHDWLGSGGWLVIEHGFEQGRAVRELFVAHGYRQVVTATDLAGVERATRGCV